MEEEAKKLIEMWQERQRYYEDLAIKYKDYEHNFKKYTYKAMATRDCWKELNTLLKKIKQM